MPEPYIVRPTGPGTADVVDRATGERMGWVHEIWSGGWEAHRGGELSWPRNFVGYERLRADAARAVWEARGGGAG